MATKPPTSTLFSISTVASYTLNISPVSSAGRWRSMVGRWAFFVPAPSQTAGASAARYQSPPGIDPGDGHSCPAHGEIYGS